MFTLDTLPLAIAYDPAAFHREAMVTRVFYLLLFHTAMKPLLYCALASLLLAGCSDEDDGQHVPPDQSPHYMLYSPNGEPLNGGPLGTPTCPGALGGWFDRMSKGGGIPAGAFLKDAQLQFARMDIDHNGYIVSEELDRFRAPYRQAGAYKESSEVLHGIHKGRRQPGHADPSLSMPDPVMTADTNLDFKVTPEEFTRQARDVFARLDANNDGMLSRAEVLAWCDQKKPEEKE